MRAFQFERGVCYALDVCVLQKKLLSVNPTNVVGLELEMQLRKAKIMPYRCAMPASVCVEGFYCELVPSTAMGPRGQKKSRQLRGARPGSRRSESTEKARVAWRCAKQVRIETLLVGFSGRV